jgi:hypothetical protein
VTPTIGPSADAPTPGDLILRMFEALMKYAISAEAAMEAFADDPQVEQRLDRDIRMRAMLSFVEAKENLYRDIHTITDEGIFQGLFPPEWVEQLKRDTT